MKGMKETYLVLWMCKTGPDTFKGIGILKSYFFSKLGVFLELRNGSFSINMSYITDLHCHISLKPYNNDGIKGIWEDSVNPTPDDFFARFNLIKNTLIKKFHSDIATFSQTNLDNCIKGNLTLVFCSLYPIERKFMNKNSLLLYLLSSLFLFKKSFPFLNLINKQRFILTSLLMLMLGASKERAIALFKEVKKEGDSVDYFSELEGELKYLIDSQQSKSKIKANEPYRFLLVNSYQELQQSMASNTKTIHGIVTIEGMHTLVEYTVRQLFLKHATIDALPENEKAAMENTFIRNVRKLKVKTSTTPFFITFAHHFNNFLCGHAQSFSGGMGAIFRQHAKDEMGLSVVAQRLIKDHLLSKDQGRRILIDIKHMSVQSRLDYYTIVDDLGEVPIISSHSSVNGEKNMSSYLRNGRVDKRGVNRFVSQGSIGLTDHDIMQIYKSDGLIGILMHEGRMPGKLFRKLKKKTSKKDLPRLYIRLFLTNVYHIINVVYHVLGENGWKLVTLGTDMDGIIDPFDSYPKASFLTAFRNHVYNYLDQYPDKDEDKIVNLYDESKPYISKDLLKVLNQGMTVKEIVDGIFYKNAEKFLEKYYTKEYLE